jgi:hypothetical protein
MHVHTFTPLVPRAAQAVGRKVPVIARDWLIHPLQVNMGLG